MDGLTEGRIVHYVIRENEHRPAIVVKVWNNNGTANLTVFSDWSNDSQYIPNHQESEFAKQMARGVFWATSVNYSETKVPSTWHWIEKVAPEAVNLQMPTANLIAVTESHGTNTYQVAPATTPSVVDWYDYGKSAYHAYGAVTDHKNYQGLPMPEWEALTDKIREAWIGAVQDVFRKLQVRDHATGKLYVE